jgi:hypothetical protein
VALLFISLMALANKSQRPTSLYSLLNDSSILMVQHVTMNTGQMRLMMSAYSNSEREEA